MANRRKNVKLPLCFEVLATLLDSHFVSMLPRRHLLSALDTIGSYLGAVFATETAQRGANWVGKQACKTGDIRFQLGVGDPAGDCTVEVTGEAAKGAIMGEGNRECLSDILQGVCRIKRVDVDIVNTKQKKSLTVSVERRTTEEAKITEMFGIWLIISGTKDDDPFMARYGISKNELTKQERSRARKSRTSPDYEAQASRRLICAKDCSSVIKEGAEKMGLPAVHFSMKSCRSAAITIMSSAGSSTDVIHKRSGHGPKSMVSKTHYNHHTSQHQGGRGSTEGPAALNELSSFGVEELRRLVRMESFSGDAAAEGEGESLEELDSGNAQPKRRSSLRQRRSTTREFPSGKGATSEI
jgi:hypothetical protein